MKVAVIAAVLACLGSLPTVAASYDDLNGGIEMLNQANLTPAFVFFSKAITAKDLPPSLEGVAYLGRALARGKDDSGGALADLSQAIELAPDLRQAVFERARINARLGKFEAAEKDYDALIAISPNSAEVRFARSYVLESQKNYSGSLADMMVALNGRPQQVGYAAIYDRVGLLNWHLNNLDEVQKIYSKELEIDPSSASAWLYLALVNAEVGKPLREGTQKLARTGWSPRLIASLVAFFQGKTTEDEVMRINQESVDNAGINHVCDLAFYLGSWAILHGNKDGGKSMLDAHVAVCSKDQFSWAATGFQPDGR